MIGRRLLGQRLFGLALVSLVAAPLAARAAAVAEVAEPIATFDDALMAVMKEGASAGFQQRYQMLAPVVGRTFDLPAILQTCVGPRWAQLTAEEQRALVQAFEQFTVASWVANFATYNGEKFEISPDLRAVGAEQVVQTKITSATGETQRIDYLMRQGPEGWRAVDVLLDGTISRVAVQRSDFRNLLAGGAQALISSLRQKVADLSGGQLPS
jgi:phospholipid transport system substrate-binding protein